MAIELSDTIVNDRPDTTPFDEGVAPGEFFVDQVRTLSFNKLVHLAPYSELLLVCGPYGVGKTALLQQFVAKAADTWRAALIQVRESDSDADLLLKIIERIEMPLVITDESRGMLLDSLARFLESLGRSGRRAIIVIDDAQNLDAGQLAMLGALLSDYRVDNALSLILAAPAEFAPRVKAVKELASRLTYTLELQPLGVDEVERYISHRLAMNGAAAEGRLFTPEVVEEIHLQSEGYPARINHLVRNVLQTHKIERVRRPGRGSGVGRWSMVGAGAVVIVLIVLFQDEINRFYSASEAQQGVAVVDPIGASQISDESALVTDLKNSVDADGARRSIVSPGGAGVIVVPAPVVGEALSEEAMSEPAEPPAELLAAIKLPVAEEGNPAAVEARTLLSTPGPETAAEEKEERPALTEEQQWLLSQPETNYTLQLMALKDDKRVRNFADKHRLRGRSAVFFTTRKGHRLAVLVLGSFSSQMQAKEAAAQLPRGWGIRQPWVRSFASVQADFRAEPQ